MTARYSTAEQAAARRLKMRPALGPEPFGPAWLADFRKVYVSGARDEAAIARARAREAAKRAAQFDRIAADAALLARGISREQRRAGREARP